MIYNVELIALIKHTVNNKDNIFSNQVPPNELELIGIICVETRAALSMNLLQV